MEIDEKEIIEIIEIGLPKSIILRKYSLKSEKILTEDLIKELFEVVKSQHEKIDTLIFKK